MSDHPTSSQPLAASSSQLLLGGTFDPPHIGHLLIAECAHHELGGTVVFLPAGDPWRKAPSADMPGAEVPAAGSPSAEGPTAAHHRLAMTRLATAGVPHFAIDDREVRRPGPSYTVDTLEELRAEGHTRLALLLGSDAIADMPNWKQPARIRELATIVEVRRGAGESGQREAGSGKGATLSSFPAGLAALSSTLIRARVTAGLPIRWLVPPAVEAYIEKHGLYRSEQ